MNKLNIGLVGLGNVGGGVVKLLQRHRGYFKAKYDAEFNLKSVHDRSIDRKRSLLGPNVETVNHYNDIIRDPEIDVVIELIGGMHPARDIMTESLKNGKHVITANKEVIAQSGKELFELAQKHNRHIYFESSVGAGIPIIKALTEGVAGNKFRRLYGIINGTCNFILTEMGRSDLTFRQALEEAQRKGFAESDPSLDINGTDSAHKLAILVYLAFGKSITSKDIHVEGITHISHDDIEHANSLNLTIKLLAIAKRVDSEIEARVHPTLIPKDHPLASINGIFNALFLDVDPLGDVMLSGEGAGQMAAASGVISDLVNLSARHGSDPHTLISNLVQENQDVVLRKIDQIRTKFYLRFMASDKPGVLASIAGILGNHGISINSVTQKVHNQAATVPIIMLTEEASEEKARLALDEIYKIGIVKSKPVAIRMEKP